jgi:hypothetical protein
MFLRVSRLAVIWPTIPHFSIASDNRGCRGGLFAASRKSPFVDRRVHIDVLRRNIPDPTDTGSDFRSTCSRRPHTHCAFSVSCSFARIISLVRYRARNFYDASKGGDPPSVIFKGRGLDFTILGLRNRRAFLVALSAWGFGVRRVRAQASQQQRARPIRRERPTRRQVLRADGLSLEPAGHRERQERTSAKRRCAGS